MARPSGMSPPLDLATPLAELAARLGSPVTFDRRGNVVWLEDFEQNLLKWTPLSAGNGGSVALSSEWVRNGARGCRLTTGDAVGDTAQIVRTWPFIGGRTGFEISFGWNANLDRIRFQLFMWPALRIGVSRLFYTADIAINPSTSVLTVNDNALGFVTLDRVSLPTINTMKLVVDMTTFTYVRLLLNENSYDLSRFNMVVGLSLSPAQTWTEVDIRTSVASNQAISVDDAIFTKDEP